MDKTFWVEKYKEIPINHPNMIYTYEEYILLNKVIEKVDKWLFLKCHIKFNLNLNDKELVYLMETPLINKPDLTYFTDHTVYINPKTCYIQLMAPNVFYPVAGLLQFTIIDYKLLLIKLLYLYPSNFIINQFL